MYSWLHQNYYSNAWSKIIICKFIWYDDLNLVHFVEAPGTSKRSQITLSREISLNPGKLIFMYRESFARGWQVWIIRIRNYELAVFLCKIDNYRCHMQRISQSIMLDNMITIPLLQDLQIQKQYPSSSHPTRLKWYHSKLCSHSIILL